MNYLDIFYNDIIKEAAIGRIDCFFMYNILFDTKILEDNIHIKSQNKNDFIVPTLIIKNKEKFNDLLIQYVNLSKDFYDLSKFENELNSKDNIKNIKIEKIIMSLLWSNATVEDFSNPIEYLEKRIAFIKDAQLSEYKDEKIIGHSKILDSYISIKIYKDSIQNETPYMLSIKLIDDIDSNKTFNLPNVKLGIYDNKAYIYAIQNSRDNVNKNEYTKKINRKLFKIGENFIDDTIHEDDNLKDVTSSFVISANIVLSIIENIGISEVIIPSLLIERWNSRFITDKIKNENNEKNHVLIQKNLTEKFLRTFRRIIYHTNHIDIESYPFENDSNLHLSYNDNVAYSNNPLLDETYNLINNKNKRI